MKIKFGTDGWRGIIAEDFTFANLRRVSAAVARYIKEEGKSEQGLVIGRDTRFLAEEFARTVAETMTAAGIKVYLTKEAMPTPVTAYSVLAKEAAGAVMLTASHNPPEHNGFKFIPDYAGPALPHITDRITALIPETAAPVRGNQDLAEVFDPKPAYYDFLSRQVDLEKIKSSGLRVVINPMHGAGIGYLEEIFAKLNLPASSQRNWRDPLFDGQMPEPKPALLEDLRQAILAGQGDLGLALDGDGDRFGIIDGTGAYLQPNDVLTLLARYLVEVRGLKGTIARTVSTTTLLDRIASRSGIPIIETPVGFKYLAQAMMEQQAFLAGEESGGLSIAGHIPEKDGILACLLMAEITAHYGKPLTAVLEDIHKEYGRLYSRRLDIKCTPQTKEKVLEKLTTFAPSEIGGNRVIGAVKIDGSKFILEKGSWVLVRPSGTEALFRIYAEAETEPELEKIQRSLATKLGLQ
ncbi:MAG: phosphoglucomutase/phosphomannomutase family protein [Eubacteriales bacterium]|nr:phosphoglucomutase/phosphomannomutase family protein [Eubacteriales bacterium]